MNYKYYSTSTLNYLRIKYTEFYNIYNKDYKNIKTEINRLQYRLIYLETNDNDFNNPTIKAYLEIINSLNERKKVIEIKKIDLLKSIEDIENILKTRGVIINADF